MATNERNTIIEAINRLQDKLIDLSGFNRLINFKHTKGRSLQLANAALQNVYDRLINDGKSIDIQALPEPDESDYVSRNGRMQRPDEKSWATIQGVNTDYTLPLKSDEKDAYKLSALQYEHKLGTLLRKIEREARLGIEETGSNMLYLIMGFLEYPDRPDGERLYQAPLLSIPISITKEKKRGKIKYSISYTGEDITENLSLMKKLLDDFDIDFPDLPEDEINFEQFFSKIEKVIRDKRNFEIKPFASIGLLSYSSMLLYKDLDPKKWDKRGRENRLYENEVITQIFGEKGENENDLTPDIFEENNVESEKGDQVPLIFDADSSQHSAIMEVIYNKKNLVIEGPPGTGKSQTIANLLATCLKNGKKVLFVSEKLAALQVVRKRLEQAGLGIFTLELHSNKTNRKEVLKDIERRVKSNRFKVQNSFGEEELKQKRAELKNYSTALQHKVNSRIDFTVQELVWKKEYSRQQLIEIAEQIEHLKLENAVDLSFEQLNKIKKVLQSLAVYYKQVGTVGSKNPFFGIYLPDLNLFDSSKLFNVVERLKNAAAKLGGTIEEFDDKYNVDYYNAGRHYWSQQLGEIRCFHQSMPESLPYNITAKLCENGVLKPHVRHHFYTLQKQLNDLNEFNNTVSSYFNISKDFVAIPYSEVNEAVSNFAELNLDKLPISEIGRQREVFITHCATLHAKVDSLNQKLSSIGVREITNSSDIQHLNLFVDHILSSNSEIFRYQSPQLVGKSNLDDIRQIIDTYRSIKRQWTTLGNIFYLDILPPERDIKKAISVLREGNKWYRIFQKRWRDAVNSHKQISKSKKTVDSDKRLKDLELLSRILNEIESFNTGSLVKEYFTKENNPFGNIDFEALSDLIDWNEKYNSLRGNLYHKEAVRLVRSAIRELKDKMYPVQEEIREVILIERQLNELFQNPVLSNQVDYTVFLKSVAIIDTWLNRRFQWIETYVKPSICPEHIQKAMNAYESIKRLQSDITSQPEYPVLFGEEFRGSKTNVNPIEELIYQIEKLSNSEISESIRTGMVTDNLFIQVKEAEEILSKIHQEYQVLDEEFNALDTLCKTNRKAFITNAASPGANEHNCIIHRCNLILDNAKQIEPNHTYAIFRQKASSLNLQNFIELAEQGLLTESRAEAMVDFAYANEILKNEYSPSDGFGKYHGSELNNIRTDFRRLDKKLEGWRRNEVHGHCLFNAYPPKGSNSPIVDEKTEMGLIKLLLPQKRPRVTVRKLINRAPKSLQELKPCFMMGPQAVAQYLTPGVIEFDIVIMDEASQLKPEYAIGAIARARQLVVVGDSNQLPPTSFFNRMNDSTDDDSEETVAESESILDLCRSQFKTVKKLLWHYRSQHHSLIAFSNLKFYDNELLVFPSPREQSDDLGLSAIYLKDAVYENQVNKQEAIKVADMLIEHMLKKSKDSIGVVTLNIKQKELISEIFETRKLELINDDEVWEHWNNQAEPIFIKNLENVQGDERDCIIISTTYGKALGTKVVRQNFGPISNPDGWRRLNVLFTRARKSVTVVTSLLPSDILTDRATHDGSKVLQQYLAYIQTGVLEQGQNTGMEPDSEFERAVIKVLERHGFDVTPQLGVAGYRIDIAVKNPKSRNSYMAAIECDGAQYHSAKSARDRDRIRQEVLESLGWENKIWRIWSTDWFRNPEAETAKLISFLNSLETYTEYTSANREPWVTITSKGEVQDSGFQTPIVGSVIGDIEDIDETISQLEEKEVVEVGDTVIYQEKSERSKNMEVTITINNTNDKKKLIARKAPLAQALLNASVGDEVTLDLKNDVSRVFVVKEIRKAK
ncbi:Superfamily I DNA and/or RNA helicase [Cyclonatronum proteinivorum]|uniref:Superfamily I DNA and/or RNA helicase n=1 Tax=Cyclonatronum proteinivorum TaxID=1457365 RepID=A0A345UPZ4_9BACT|nr:DUF4011 domain-containing protein [Cyclonatronum proteinivorum]AXJ02546.1 Superfamily I DNA and/or RNA helicase [Cyclonatronum proteinivorum]